MSRPPLDLLRSADCVIAAMTNSPQATAEAQLTNAGLIGSFDRVMSVALVERFKPHPSVYKVAAARLAVPINEMTMVAAHDWDVAGAMAAGARGALVLRDGVSVNPLYPRPTITGSDLMKVAEALVG